MSFNSSPPILPLGLTAQALKFTPLSLFYAIILELNPNNDSRQMIKYPRSPKSTLSLGYLVIALKESLESRLAEKYKMFISVRV
jgi:hypothetical protein